MANRWYPARMMDGSGWMIVEITGPWSERDEKGERTRPARAARVELSEVEARALCRKLNAAAAPEPTALRQGAE